MDSGEGNLRLKGDSHSSEGTGALGGMEMAKAFHSGSSLATGVSLKFSWIFSPTQWVLV